MFSNKEGNGRFMTAKRERQRRRSNQYKRGLRVNRTIAGRKNQAAPTEITGIEAAAKAAVFKITSGRHQHNRSPERTRGDSLESHQVLRLLRCMMPLLNAFGIPGGVRIVHVQRFPVIDDNSCNISGWEKQKLSRSRSRSSRRCHLRTIW
jgi:hypothetical protein